MSFMVCITREIFIAVSTVLLKVDLKTLLNVDFNRLASGEIVQRSATILN